MNLKIRKFHGSLVPGPRRLGKTAIEILTIWRGSQKRVQKKGTTRLTGSLNVYICHLEWNFENLIIQFFVLN